MDPQPVGDDWIALTGDPLPTELGLTWAITPHCGAVATFAGTVRDHSDGRAGVSSLEYEAYVEQVEPRLRAIAAAARVRWPVIGRIALWHRIGLLNVGEVSVVAIASTPHRAESFEASRFLIDTLKVAVPIWKKETWGTGSDWSLCDHEIQELDLAAKERDSLMNEIDDLSGVVVEHRAPSERL